MKQKKKKGRPPSKPPQNPISTPPKPIDSSNRRSTRRNPSYFHSPPPQPDFDEDDDDDERKEKKVKLVVRLPQSDESNKSNQKPGQQVKRHSQDSNSDSGSGSVSDSDPESVDRDSKKFKINSNQYGSEDAVSIEEEKVVTVTNASRHGSDHNSSRFIYEFKMKQYFHPMEYFLLDCNLIVLVSYYVLWTGSQLEYGPTTPLPDKKMLDFILDRLQKKDTYGVFSEPVDPNELPDYFEIIKQPMDFGTVRKKLEGGAYKSLDDLEADVLLICSNAMQYNATDTVYYRQARSIQELAKRDFDNLKHEGADGEPQPKVVRRGRPPSNKNLKKPSETSPLDRVDPEVCSGATLASEDKPTGSNSYNLRKTPTLHRFRFSDQFMSSQRARNGEYSELLIDWNNEFPASILRADMKYGKKFFTVDENRRDTYRQFHPLSPDNVSTLSYPIGDIKRLVPVGLQEPLAYARSVARYAANLGPVAWKIASKKIESALPAGAQYGPGWVGENGGTPSQPTSFSTEKQKSSNNDSNSSRFATPSTSDLSSAVRYGPSEAMVEAVRKLNHQNEIGAQGDASSWRTPFPAQQKLAYQPSHRNGFSGIFGCEVSTSESARVSKMEGGLPVVPHTLKSVSAKLPENWGALKLGYTVPPQGKVSDSCGDGEMLNYGRSSSQSMPMQQPTHSPTVPPDLNMRVPAGSPSSSLQISSPQQPDLALQL